MEKRKKYDNDEIEMLSKKNWKLKKDIESNTDNEKKKLKSKERKEIKKEINKCMKEQENEELDNKLKHLENLKDDSSKYFAVMR